MRRVETTKLIPGMVSAEDIYNFSDQLIIPANTPLTDKAITKLAFYSILSIKIKDTSEYIDDSHKQHINNNEFETSYSQRVKMSAGYIAFKANFEDEVNDLREELVNVVRENSEEGLNNALNSILTFVSTEKESVNLLDMVHNMRLYSDETFSHSLNVALLSNILASWLHLSESDIAIATQCGLLHDIGKISVPNDILHKPSSLDKTELEIIRSHPAEGYKTLQNFDLDERIRNSILMHHERRDGSGYPFGLVGDKIDYFARIVAIADVYDAMTSPRIYKPAVSPFEVIAMFESEGYSKYDPKFIMIFLENVVNACILNRVRLNDGTIGDIIFINKGSLSRPTIKSGRKYIDLSKERNLHIVEIL